MPGQGERPLEMPEWDWWAYPHRERADGAFFRESLEASWTVGDGEVSRNDVTADHDESETPEPLRPGVGRVRRGLGTCSTIRIRPCRQRGHSVGSWPVSSW